MTRAKALAKKIVQRCKELGIELIAVTDHNTPSNVEPLALGHTWYGLLREAANGMKENGVCVLPGVEISTDDLHLLVIVDPVEGPQKDIEDPQVQPEAYQQVEESLPFAFVYDSIKPTPSLKINGNEYKNCLTTSHGYCQITFNVPDRADRLVGKYCMPPGEMNETLLPPPGK